MNLDGNISADRFVEMYLEYMNSDHHKRYNAMKFNHRKRGYFIQDSMRDYFSGIPVPEIKWEPHETLSQALANKYWQH